MAVMKMLLGGLYLLLAGAMVAQFNVLKLRGIWYGIFALGAVVISTVYIWATLARSV
jgi:hypothetical protein